MASRGAVRRRAAEAGRCARITAWVRCSAAPYLPAATAAMSSPAGVGHPLGNLSGPGRHYPMVVSFSVTGSDVSDAALVAAARNGDRTAAALLLERHRPLVLRLCRRFVASPQLAEDAAQEACLQALLGLDRLRDPSCFAPWLAGIGLNVCRNWLRQPIHESLSAAATNGGWFEPVADWSTGPEDVAEAADIATRVRRAVADLPAGQRSAVVGFYLSGLTYQETAASLGIGVQALKTRLHKGRAGLRARLQSLWEDEMARSVDMTEAASDLVEMRVADVRRGADDAQPAAHVVLLEEVNGDRLLPIWIGPQEGMSMARLLENTELPRPMAPQFMFNALRAVDARVVEVRIDRLAERTFYAVAVVEGPSGRAEVDARPSDALNAALLAKARVTVRRELLEFDGDDDAPRTLASLHEKFPESAKDVAAKERAECAERRAAESSAP